MQQWIAVEWANGIITVQVYTHPNQLELPIENYNARCTYGPFFADSYEAAQKHALAKMRPEVE